MIRSANFDLRRELYGDEALGAANLEVSGLNNNLPNMLQPIFTCSVVFFLFSNAFMSACVICIR